MILVSWNELFQYLWIHKIPVDKIDSPEQNCYTLIVKIKYNWISVSLKFWTVKTYESNREHKWSVKAI